MAPKYFCVKCDKATEKLRGVVDGYTSPGYCNECWDTVPRDSRAFKIGFRSTQIALLSEQNQRLMRRVKALETMTNNEWRKILADKMVELSNTIETKK